MNTTLQVYKTVKLNPANVTRKQNHLWSSGEALDFLFSTLKLGFRSDHSQHYYRKPH